MAERICGPKAQQAEKCESEASVLKLHGQLVLFGVPA